MMLQKSVQWGLLLSLVGGLSSCLMDNQQGRSDSAQSPMFYEQSTMKQTKANATPGATATKVSSSGKEPLQVTTPGPKRAAAPQLPVIN
jgi:hypothetical protein